MRIIDGDLLKKDLESSLDQHKNSTFDMYDRGATNSYRNALDLLDEQPPAQPEIIRCKDCENWIPGYITDNDDFIPPKCGKYQQMVGHSSNDYCSLAERRTDE